MAEAEVESEMEQEIKTESEAEIAKAVSTEPEPNWPIAFEKWGPAWYLHVYGMASLFSIIAVVTAMSMLYYLKDRRLLGQGKLTFTLQCLLLYFTMLRALALFSNPYQTVDHLDSDAFGMMWSFALPGLTAAFSVLLLVFLDTTKMTLGPPIFQKLSVLLTFTTCHFLIVVSSDVLCLTSDLCKPLLLFCQVLFILYGTLLSVGYLYTAISIHGKCINSVISAAENRKIVRLIKISGVASFVAISVAITHVYAAFSDFGIYSDVTYVKAWDWWILQSVMRLEEVISGCLILVIAFRNPFGEPRVLSGWMSKLQKRKTYPNAHTNDVKSRSTKCVTSSDISNAQ